MSGTIKRTLTRDMADRSRVVARLEMREPGTPGNLSAAFSATGEVYLPHGTWSGHAQQRNGRSWDMGGCVHDQLLRAFPKLARFVDMHLADPISGSPWHGGANGWYFYAGSRADLRATEEYTGFHGIYEHQLTERGLSDDDAGREEYCYQLACKILRVESIPRGLDRASFYRFADDLQELWRYEAQDARAFIESLPADTAQSV